ncbi:interleukin-18-like [Trichosurus vulpecula]|uniref:interleukin-18-like n=1 Tax=Trichosurus vulpecula TaxID=9337 RepID=UPI00186B2377|nr:interleukin-18-like [Trichosurus vulpecula]
MAAVDDCQEVACAPEVDCKFNLDFAYFMESELREDACCLSGGALFKRAGVPICIMLKNSKQKVLFFNKKEETAIFEEMSDGEIEDNAPWTQFMLQYYGCEGSTPLVAISVRGENKSYLLTCKSDREIQFKDGDFPDKIADGDKNILFWLNIVVGSEKIEFKSFLYPEHYLACGEKWEDSDKLVLKEEYDSEETSTMFVYVTCKKKIKL